MIASTSYLCREGDPADFSYVLLSGWACRHKISISGARQITAFQLPGELNAPGAGVLDAIDYNIQILVRSWVGYVPNEALTDLTTRFAGIERAVRRETAIEACVAREWIFNVGRRSARQRVAHLVCELGVRLSPTIAEPGQSSSIEIPLSQEQIGDATGLTAVHVNRTIQGLRSDGLLLTDKHRIEIPNWDAFRRVAEFNPTYLHYPSASRPPAREQVVRAGWG